MKGPNGEKKISVFFINFPEMQSFLGWSWMKEIRRKYGSTELCLVCSEASGSGVLGKARGGDWGVRWGMGVGGDLEEKPIP